MYTLHTNAYMCIIRIIYALYMHTHKVCVCMCGRIHTWIQIMVSAKEKSKMGIGLKFYVKWASKVSLR